MTLFPPNVFPFVVVYVVFLCCVRVCSFVCCVVPLYEIVNFFVVCVVSFAHVVAFVVFVQTRGISNQQKLQEPTQPTEPANNYKNKLKQILNVF